MSKEFDQRISNFFKNYQDRGMKKWQGFYLSEHTSTIQKFKAKNATVYTKKRTMSEAAISQQLLKAFAEHYSVSIQLSELTSEGDYLDNVRGWVEGYQNSTVIVSGRKIDLAAINHIELLA
ncbi:hypothetical protein [Lactobacillus corticis]|uniref:DNA-directed RNA polymerase beta subunit n=1 Tax=Lactobacillus corticis TaxID=2201249 RepID=A0A916QKF9_9LACO|nr:hypothetical protein [Lactobacillus corticis]GFZ27528.1 hypothetical protein LCB40_14080 [Lactobacillus corticis]